MRNIKLDQPQNMSAKMAAIGIRTHACTKQRRIPESRSPIKLPFPGLWTFSGISGIGFKKRMHTNIYMHLRNYWH